MIFVTRYYTTELHPSQVGIQTKFRFIPSRRNAEKSFVHFLFFGIFSGG
jgi:hypothetical protein